MEKVESVLFDVGNVLIRFDPDYILENLFEDAAVRKGVKRTLFLDPLWLALDRGTEQPGHVARILGERYPDLAWAYEKLMEEWIDFAPAMDESVKRLERLKGEGYRLYVLSNFARQAFYSVAGRNPFFKLFDGIMISAEQHLLKPDLEIFRRAAKDFHLTPSRTLFIDDSAGNVEAAGFLGFQTLLFRKAEQIDQVLPAKNA